MEDVESKSSSSRVSSSSTSKLSSTVTRSSSSAKPVFDPKDVVYGKLTDSRNEQTYKTVKIGTQKWMAENLNFANDTVFSGCIPDDLGGCEKYGRAYMWHSAMELKDVSKNSEVLPSELKENINSPHRGVCPSGWHIPTDKEWDILIDYVESHNGEELAGTSLKADNWQVVEGLPQGTNRFGFSAIEAGNFYTSRLAIDFYISTNPLNPTPNRFRPLAGSIYDPSTETYTKVVHGGARFCSTVGNVKIVDDEFIYKVQDDVRNGCSVRCIED